jgi:hypothetical protein
MEGVKIWLSSQASLTQAHKNLFPDASALIPAVTVLRSSLSICIFCI